MAGSLLGLSPMDMVWYGVFALLACGLVKRHGWEYVPLVIFLGVGRWYTTEMAIGDMVDGLTLASFAGVWVVSGRTQD